MVLLEKQILLVDDDPHTLNLLGTCLRHEHIEVVKIHDPQRVPETLDVMMPDLIILDDRMPMISGHDLYYYIRHRAHTASTPIIFLVSWDDPEIVSLVCGSEINVRLRKPFTCAHLLRSVRQFLEHKAVQQAA